MERDLVLRGLAENPAVPDDVLTRLLADWPEPVARGLVTRAELSPVLQRRLAGHPSRRVRRTVAGHPRLEPGVVDDLADDPDWWVRLSLAGARNRRPPLSEATLVRLMPSLLDPPADVPYTEAEIVDEWFWPDWTRVLVAARHPDPRVRLIAASSGWLDGLRPLLTDPDARVAAAAAASRTEHERLMEPADLPRQHCHAFWWVLHRPLSAALAGQVAASADLDAVECVAQNTTTPPHVVERLAGHPHAGIRAVIAARKDLTGTQVEALSTDPAPEVRAVVATRPGLSAARIAALSDDPDDGVRTAAATHAHLSAGDRAILDGGAVLTADRAVRWARADNPRLRRRAAQHPDLPGDLVTLLAADPDPAVRTALALHHPAAPGELLLSTYLDDPCRTGLRHHPRFPRTGLSHLAMHADPRVRLLAARDPGTDPAVITALTADPDPGVRSVMARCPRLPADRLTALLEDAGLAVDAAANPALDWAPVVEAVRRLPG